MSKNDFEKLKILDFERSSSFLKRSHLVHQKNTQIVISKRIKQVIQKLDVSARILIINCSWYENFISKEILESVDCSIDEIKKSNLEEFLSEMDNLIKKKNMKLLFFNSHLELKFTAK